jgi:ABC-type tungstate transport system substrate-binding protein
MEPADQMWFDFPGRLRRLDCAVSHARRTAMSLGTILIIIVLIYLLGGWSGRLGGYGYGLGHSGMGLGVVVLVVLIVLMLVGKI